MQDDRRIIAAGLGQICSRRRYLWTIFWALLPAVMLVSAIFPHDETIFLITGLTGMALWIFAGIRVGLSACPRCGMRFHSRPGFGNPFTRHCLHCGLRLQRNELG